jgi:hypothetical protein
MQMSNKISFYMYIIYASWNDNIYNSIPASIWSY